MSCGQSHQRLGSSRVQVRGRATAPRYSCLISRPAHALQRCPLASRPTPFMLGVLHHLVDGRLILDGVQDRDAEEEEHERQGGDEHD